MPDEKNRERKCPLPIFDIIYFTTLSSILLSLHHDLFAVYDVQALCGLGNAATAQIVEVTLIPVTSPSKMIFIVRAWAVVGGMIFSQQRLAGSVPASFTHVKL